MNTIGHVAYERRGRDLYLRCNYCRNDEIILDFENGGRPRVFALSGTRVDEQEFAKCLRCLMVHDRGSVKVSARAGYLPW